MNKKTFTATVGQSPVPTDKQRISQALRKLRYGGHLQPPFMNDMTDAEALQATADFLEAFVPVLANAADRSNTADRKLEVLETQRRAVREFLGVDVLLSAMTQAGGSDAPR